MVLMPPGTMRFSPICLKATQIWLVIKSLDQSTNGEAGKHLLGLLEEKGNTAKTSVAWPLETISERDSPARASRRSHGGSNLAHETALTTSVGFPRAALLTGGWSHVLTQAEKPTGVVIKCLLSTSSESRIVLELR